MGQNELITGWVYRKGELVRQRINDRGLLIRFFSGPCFAVYKKLFVVKEEEIIFTNHKIASTNKTWILNDEINKLISVQLNTKANNPGLVFKITMTRKGKQEYHYKIHIPVPEEELMNAEKICSYFNSGKQPGN